MVADFAAIGRANWPTTLGTWRKFRYAALKRQKGKMLCQNLVSLLSLYLQDLGNLDKLDFSCILDPQQSGEVREKPLLVLSLLMQ